MRLLRALTVLLPGILAAQESAPAAPESRPLLSRAQMESDLAFLEAAIREKWSYLEDREKNFGVDLAALVKTAKGQLRDQLTKAEFHQVVLELVASLKDGHANVFTLGVAQPQRRWPFRVEETADGFVVVEGSGGRSPAVGERILTVDGSPLGDQVVARCRTTIASTEPARRRAALRRLHETDSPTVAFGLTRPDGDRASVTVATLGPNEGRTAAAKPEPVWSVDRPAPGIARLRVRSFTVEDWAAWLAAPHEKRDAILADTRARIDACFGEIAGAKALVVDLRGNGGGTDLLGIHLAKHMLPKRFVYYMLSAKRDGKWSKPHAYEHDPLPAAQRFDGPLAILVDEECFSTTDNCLRSIIESRDDVIVVGRPTNGGTGAPGMIAKLPVSETFVTLCTMRVYGPKGDLIEGRGTQPTIRVRWTAADYVEKRDPDLAAAISALEKAASRPK